MFEKEIVKHIGTYKINRKSGWTGELNLVSWNGREPKLEVREWSPDHQMMSKGMTFTENEARRLSNLLKELFEEVEIDAGTEIGEEDVFDHSEDGDAYRTASGSEC